MMTESTARSGIQEDSLSGLDVTIFSNDKSVRNDLFAVDEWYRFKIA